MFLTFWFEDLLILGELFSAMVFGIINIKIYRMIDIFAKFAAVFAP